MSLTSRKILPLTFFLNLLLNIAFLVYSGTLRLPRFPGSVSNELTAHNPDTGAHTNPGWTAQLSQQPTEPVSFVMVMYGEPSAKEGLLALKTALMHISRPAEFHIICSPDAIPIIQDKLGLFSR
jgi:hypothetical protein